MTVPGVHVGVVYVRWWQRLWVRWPTDEAASLLQPVNVGTAGTTGAAGAAGAAGSVAHTDLVIVSLINVTLPLRARSLPSTFAPLSTVIEVRAKMLPLNTAVVPMVAVLSRQKTLQA